MKWKLFVGIFLMIFSAVCMYMWETHWRDEVTLDKVIVAACDLYEGDIADESDFKSISITPQSRIEGSLTEKDISSISGKLVISDIKENQQLSFEYFSDFRNLRKEGYRNFVIPASWIDSVPENIGSKSYISIYSIPNKKYLNSYRVTAAYEEGGFEIEAMLDDYYMIYDEISSGNRLLIVSED